MHLFIVFFLCWARKEMSKWGSDRIFEVSLKTTRTCCLGRIFNDTDEYIAMHGLKQSPLTCGYLYIYIF